MEMIKENELKNGRPKGTVKAVWQKREWQIKKKKKIKIALILSTVHKQSAD
jgi:hypothetical protein